MTLVDFEPIWLVIEIIIGIIAVISFIIVWNRNYEKKQNYDDLVKNKDVLLMEEFGKEGERYVSSMLSTIPGTYLINDFTFKNDKLASTNIDHILITKAGIFVIETKANKGKIIGTSDDDTWQALKGTGKNQTKKELANPIMQNSSHIYHLKYVLGKNAPKIYSLIIFPFADIHLVTHLKICDCGSARSFIENKIKYGKYDNKKMLEIYNQLVEIRNTYGISIQEHIENINSMHSS